MADFSTLSKYALIGSSVCSQALPAVQPGTSVDLAAEVIAVASESQPEKKLQDGEYRGPFGTRKENAVELENLILVNGFDTNSTAAIEMARCVADRLGNPAWLIFNDLNIRNEESDDWFQEATTWIEKSAATLIEKLGDADCSVNQATDTLVEKVSACLEAGQKVHLVAHSAGALCVLNALRKLEDDKTLSEKLGSVHVLTVGSAVFEDGHPLEDGWPKGLGSVHHLVDKRDPVAQFSGPVPWDDGSIRYHKFVEHYSPHMTAAQLGTSGTTVLGESAAAAEVSR